MSHSLLKLMSIILTTTISGCIWNVDRPNPPEFERWQAPKNGDDVKLVMLECGYQDLRGMHMEGFTHSDIVFPEKCMRKNGYSQKNSTGDRFCKNYPNLDGCANSTQMKFIRSKANRLNSVYCKKYNDTRLCQ